MKKIYMLLAAVLLMVMTGCGGGGDTAQAPPSKLKAITVFYLNGVVGTIDETGKTIAVTMPYGTDVTSLVAMFMTTGASVKVDTTVQKSETTVNNFSIPVDYTVTAADGSSVTYTVTVTVAPVKPRAFTAFSLNGVVGTINETGKKDIGNNALRHRCNSAGSDIYHSSRCQRHSGFKRSDQRGDSQQLYQSSGLYGNSRRFLNDLHG